MIKIYLALVLTVSLSCLCQAQRRRSSVKQSQEGVARTPEEALRPEETRYDPRSQYPTTPRTISQHYYPTSPRRPHHDYYPTSSVSPPRNDYTAERGTEQPVTRRSPKYRRKPKQTYYPKVISFYQKPTTNNGYEFKYVTDDGVQRAERGYLSAKGVWTVEGSVTSLTEGNVAIVQTYIADAAGYKSNVRSYSPEDYSSLDDFLPWAGEDRSFESDNQLGTGGLNSL